MKTIAYSNNIDAVAALRKRVSLLVSQTNNEELLAEAIAVLSGKPLPCTYTNEEMEFSLREAEAEYQTGQTENHSKICERYGI